MKRFQGAQLAPLPRLDAKWLKSDLSVSKDAPKTEVNVPDPSPTQTVFTKDGLARLWNELIKDKEATLTQSSESSTNGGSSNVESNVGGENENRPRKSTTENDENSAGSGGGGASGGSASGGPRLSAQAIVDAWTWGDEPDEEELRDAVRSLVDEQHDSTWRAAGGTQSAERLQQRLAVFVRYFVALSRRAPSANANEPHFRPSTRRIQFARDSDRL